VDEGAGEGENASEWSIEKRDIAEVMPLDYRESTRCASQGKPRE
jgi:hypothetical protein